MGVSFDLFGTLVAVDRPASPASAVARALRERGVAVPRGFEAAYRECHVDAQPGAETPLPDHVDAALRDRGVAPDPDAVARAVRDAFDPAVRTRAGATEAVAAAAERGPVACCSNCAVPGLAVRALARSAVPRDALDALVTSVDCGWRKPDRRVFAATADRLDVPLADLVHVGDDPRTDGGVTEHGGRFVDVSDTPLTALPERLETTDRLAADRPGSGGADR